MRVVGYHGTSKDRADAILSKGFEPSTRDGLWLGTGVYFFQDAPIRARQWAEFIAAKRVSSPVTLRAVIELGDCLDLVDDVFWSRLQAYYDKFEKEIDARCAELGHQIGLDEFFDNYENRDEFSKKMGRNYKDCLLINQFIRASDEEGLSFDTIRCAFVEGYPIFKKSWLFDRSAIMITVLNRDSILHINPI